jgi:hypothetical protein
MKKLFCSLLTAFFVLVSFIPAHAGDRENSIEVGQTRDQMRQMEEQLESVREESDKRAADKKSSTEASESINGAPGTGDGSEQEALSVNR